MITERIHATSTLRSKCDHRSVRWDADLLGLMFCGPTGAACCSDSEGEFPTEASAKVAIDWYRRGEPAKLLQPLPTIHAHGTPVRTLRQRYRDAVTALEAALHALEISAPVLIDYIPQLDDEPAVWVRAARAHLSRAKRVGEVLAELQQIRDGIGIGGEV